MRVSVPLVHLVSIDGICIVPAMENRGDDGLRAISH